MLNRSITISHIILSEAAFGPQKNIFQNIMKLIQPFSERMTIDKKMLILFD